MGFSSACWSSSGSWWHCRSSRWLFWRTQPTCSPEPRGTATLQHEHIKKGQWGNTKKRIHSSSSSHGVFLISGFKWLCQRSLHCFPILSGRCWAMNVHFWGPFISTSLTRSMSSSSVQGSAFESFAFYRELRLFQFTFFALGGCFLWLCDLLVPGINIIGGFVLNSTHQRRFVQGKQQRYAIKLKSCNWIKTNCLEFEEQKPTVLARS